MNRYLFICIIVSVGLMVASARAADLIRGELLYKNHCRSCHESSVHIRKQRKAKSIADIQYWVIRWSTTLGLNWDDDTINDVNRYLNKHYYKFKGKQ